MEDKKETKVHFLLRFFRDGMPDIYAGCHTVNGRHRWWRSETRAAVAATTYGRSRPAHDARADAYRFPSRADARRTLKSPAFRDLIEGEFAMKTRGPFKVLAPRSGRIKSTSYFWEIIKVTETIVTSFEEEIVASDAPPMLTIARSAAL